MFYLLRGCWVLYGIWLLISQHIVSGNLNILISTWYSSSWNLAYKISGKFLKWHGFQKLWPVRLVYNKGCLFLKSMVFNNHFLMLAFVFLFCYFVIFDGSTSYHISLIFISTTIYYRLFFKTYFSVHCLFLANSSS